jgi:ATP-dependent Clp protease ATP-binding subunit ClpC
MLPGFTDRVSRVMALANDISRREGGSEISEIVVLIAIMEEDGGIAATLLRDVGVQLERLYRRIPPTSETAAKPNQNVLPTSSALQDVLKLAVVLARETGATDAGTEHLLVAILRHPDSLAAKALSEWDVTESKLRDAASRLS